MTDPIARLDDRGVLAVSGPDARALLQRLVTNDVEDLAEGQARYAALLTPQGKIVADFLVVAAAGDELLLDVPASVTADLARRLTLYRLRAKVEIADRSTALAVVAFAGEPPVAGLVLAYADPRHPALWRRALVRAGEAPAASAAARQAYEAERVRAGVPEGGVDFPFGDTFPHDANLDRLHGVDFRKGCYVGQEVVSRAEHRGTARKRVVPFGFEGRPPAPGSDILAGEVAVGRFGSAADRVGLGLVRVDRLAEAGAVSADGVPLRAYAGAG